MPAMKESPFDDLMAVKGEDAADIRWIEEIHQGTVGIKLRAEKVLFSERSLYQRVEVVQTPGHGRVLINDGVFMLSERDEFIYHEMIAHVPLFVHPDPKQVLIIGGGDGGTVREALRHKTVERAVMVEIDGTVVEAARGHLPGLSCALDDPRLELRIEDGVGYAANAVEASEKFDVAIVDSTDPVGPARPLFDRDFYGNISRLLSADGILVTQAESPFYDRDLQRPMLANQRPFFPRLHLYLFQSLLYPGGLWSFGFASKGLCPIRDLDPVRVRAAGFPLNYYTPAIHRAAFALPAFLLEDRGALLDPMPE